MPRREAKVRRAPYGLRWVRQHVSFCFVTLCILSLLCPGQALACQQWKIPTPFVVVQDDGYWVTFYLEQEGQEVWGEAGFQTNKGLFLGNVSGGIVGDRLGLRVLWTYSGRTSIGVYVAQINNGYIFNGSTYDEAAAKPVSVGWKAGTPLVCQDPLPSPPAAAAVPLDQQKVQEATKNEPAIAAVPLDQQNIQEYSKNKPKVLLQTAPAPAADFAGRWLTVANGGEWSIEMTFAQDSGVVSGTYEVVETGVVGTMDGTVDGNVLTLNWKDLTGGRYGGTARVTLDGNGQSFEGIYTVTEIQPGYSVYRVEGTWQAARH